MHKDTTLYEIALASALGAGLGMILAVSFGAGWWAGILLGGLAGFCSYEPRAVWTIISPVMIYAALILALFSPAVAAYHFAFMRHLHEVWYFPLGSLTLTVVASIICVLLWLAAGKAVDASWVNRYSPGRHRTWILTNCLESAIPADASSSLTMPAAGYVWFVLLAPLTSALLLLLLVSDWLLNSIIGLAVWPRLAAMFGALIGGLAGYGLSLAGIASAPLLVVPTMFIGAAAGLGAYWLRSRLTTDEPNALA